MVTVSPFLSAKIGIIQHNSGKSSRIQRNLGKNFNCPEKGMIKHINNRKIQRNFGKNLTVDVLEVEKIQRNFGKIFVRQAQ
ncbi:hypothetical protein ACFLXQ_02905 [Chloroflexota bacterium]